MKYGKLIDNKLIKAPSYLIFEGKKIWNAPAQLYLYQGWYPLVYTPYPQLDDDHYATVKWVQHDDYIEQEWIIHDIESE